MTDEIVVSTDGSALGNPNGPMGWAWADHAKDAGNGGAPGHDHDGHGYGAGGATNGTNQIGELCAVLEALRAHPGNQPLLIESDSQYAINCSTTWVRGWKRNGWRNSQKKPVKNVELIKAIDAEIARRPGPVRFRWVKGHAGNAGNELVDELARTFAGDCRSGARDGFLPYEGWQSLIASEYSDDLDVPPDVELMMNGSAKPSAGGSVSSAEGSRCDDTDDEPSGGAANGDPMRRTRSTPSSPRRSVADMLAEPEGVPDYGTDHETGSRRDSVATALTSTSQTHTARDEDPADPQRKSRPSAPTSRSEQHAVAATTASRSSDHGQQDVPSSSSPSPVSSPTASSGMDGTTAERREAGQSVPFGASHKSPASAPRPTGLTVSGTVAFSPAPKTSPTYAGQPMHVTGYIEVDGFVDGEGNLLLSNARFLRP